jgi:hypothetical protein
MALPWVVSMRPIRFASERSSIGDIDDIVREDRTVTFRRVCPRWHDDYVVGPTV